MFVRTFGAVAVGLSAAFLAGCGGGGSSAVSPSALAPGQSSQSTQHRVLAQSSPPETFPVGALNGKPASEIRLNVSRQAGWISPEAAQAKNVVYVSNLGENEVEMYRQQGANQKPLGIISDGVNFPGGLTVDDHGSLYVANEGANNVTVYPKGKTSPSITYTTDLSTATDVAVGHDGTVYIANFNGLSNGWVSVYPKGKTSNEYRISDFSGGAPLSVALDGVDDLYVMYDMSSGGGSGVNKYAPGAKTGKNLNLPLQYGAGIQVDRKHNVIVARQVQPSEILVFPAGKTNPSETIALPNGGQPFAFAIDKGETSLFAGDLTNNLAQALTYPAGTFRYTIASGFDNPSGVAVGPAQF